PAEVADLRDRAAGDAFRQLALRLLHRHRGGAAAPRRRARIVDPAQHADVVGAVGEGAPVLRAVQHPLVALAPRAALHAGKVGAGAGLGERRRAQVLALGHQLDLAASFLALARDRAVEGVAAGDDRGDAHPAARQLLGHQAVLERAEAEAAVLL